MDHINKGNWSLSSTLFLRFILLYLIFYIWPYGVEYVYNFDRGSSYFWEDITIWFGELIFGWEFNREYLYPLGDTKFGYSRLLLVIIFSLIGSLLWTFLIDLKIKINYNLKLKTLIKTVLRYHVGFVLIGFGLSKILGIQFGEMDLDNLETQTGDYPGMYFLWSFMSYSKLFSTTAGCVELIGGVLLLSRKTTFIGAFISFIAMINVVLMDIGYNVTIKVFAIHLFLMTILLLQDQMKRMIDFFILNKPTLPKIEIALFGKGRFKKVGLIIKILIVGYFVVFQFVSQNESLELYKRNDYKYMTAFHKIELLVVNGDTIPNVDSDKDRWRELSINGTSYLPETFTIRKKNKWDQERYAFEADTIAKTITYHAYSSSEEESKKAPRYQLKYEKTGKRNFIFEGVHKGDTIWMKTQYKALDDYSLTKYRLNWIID